jgi:hypothetical protein
LNPTNEEKAELLNGIGCLLNVRHKPPAHLIHSAGFVLRFTFYVLGIRLSFCAGVAAELVFLRKPISLFISRIKLVCGTMFVAQYPPFIQGYFLDAETISCLLFSPCWRNR